MILGMDMMKKFSDQFSRIPEKVGRISFENGVLVLTEKQIMQAVYCRLLVVKLYVTKANGVKEGQFVAGFVWLVTLSRSILLMV